MQNYCYKPTLEILEDKTYLGNVLSAVLPDWMPSKAEVDPFTNTELITVTTQITQNTSERRDDNVIYEAEGGPSDKFFSTRPTSDSESRKTETPYFANQVVKLVAVGS